MRRFLSLFTAGLILALSATVWAQDTIKVATTSGPDVAILEKAAEVAKGKGLTVEIVELSDYVLPNQALVNKEVDLNAFQHVPFLDDFNKERGTNLVSIGITYVSPIAYFSKKIKKIDELKEGDSVVIPNDPTNGGRCLLLLQKAGYITVKPETGLSPTPLDVTENKLNLKILEVEAPMTPQARDDAAIVCINNTFSSEFGLNPLKDSIYIEDVDSPYANVIVARDEDKDNPNFKKFVESYQSQEVADFIIQQFEGATIPLFEYKK
ncbi:MAG: MetQ/NlpA family ABC transporter substrate-binding protein [Deltaproteobacteria bacterium]|jgi:D-methionine transport system substrate-binding protein|nr:MetQ/NlpA family ABC transporter substrate-binding protein [Deltaproteobacteria bacterium]